VRRSTWLGRGVVGIVLATFLSDVGHEMVTAALPMYLASLGLGAAALGVVEGFADLVFSLSKLAGGWVGHHTERKRGLATFGYLLTAVGTGAIALVQGLAAFVSVRAAAWFGRGFRSPLRDFMLADEVDPAQFGRAYGVERAADMLGAVAGPLVAAMLLALGVEIRTVILASLVPSLLAATAFFTMTRDRSRRAALGEAAQPARRRLPRRYWTFVAGVAIFGAGDFSRTFLILLAAAAFGDAGAGALPAAVLLYAAHNVVSALAAYPAGYVADRRGRLGVLVIGYGLGVLTNCLLAFSLNRPELLLIAIALSGVYVAIEETVEKTVAAEILPRDQRSLGLGVLAAANAVGDMVSSLGVGFLLAAGYHSGAFLVPAALGLVGTAWMAWFRRLENREATARGGRGGTGRRSRA
jgi:MFS family permease